MAVPKTSINEYRQFLLLPCEIRSSREGEMTPPSIHMIFVKVREEPFFSRGVAATLNPRHKLGAGQVSEGSFSPCLFPKDHETSLRVNFPYGFKFTNLME
jgi:hypothetical protein